MANEQETVDLENNDDIQTDLEESDDSEEAKETKDEAKKPTKRHFSDEEKLAHHQGIVSRLQKKLGNETESKPEPKSVKKEPGEFDYGQKAFLRSYDIKGADELALVKDWQRRTGDELDSIVEDDIFQGKLAKLREARATAEAIPKGNKRGIPASHEDEHSWLSRIESGQAKLEDIQDIGMRRKVLNAKIDREKTGSRFSSNPVVFNQ